MTGVPGNLAALLLRARGEDPRPGTLYGVGVGPGDPGLLTLRGAAILAAVDVVGLPRAAQGTGIAAQALTDLVDPERIVPLVSPMRADDDDPVVGWRERVAPLVAALGAGRTVAVATDGDPSLYSTFAYAALAVREALPTVEVRVVPGVPAMCAAAAALGGDPLVVGDERLAVLPASRVDDAALEEAVAWADTLVLLKAGRAIPRVRRLLAGPAAGWEVGYARRVGLPGEVVGAGLDAADDDYMALVVLRRPRREGER